VAEGVGVGEPPQVGQVQRRHHQLLLARHAEHDPGGDQLPEPGGGPEQPLEDRPGLDHLLEVVRDQEQLPVAEVVAQGAQDRATGRLGDAPARARTGGPGRGR
jgi:hypothetical protein